MSRNVLVLLVSLVAVGLAGCGTPDEQESDENVASEQESVGEGEVPVSGGLVIAGVVGAAVALAVWRRRTR